MPELTVSVNGREYRISCDPGQEARVGKLAEYIDLRVRELSQGVGQVGDTTLMLMAGLLIADELSDAYDALERARTAEPAGDAAPEALAETLDRMASRISHLAERLERA